MLVSAALFAFGVFWLVLTGGREPFVYIWLAVLVGTTVANYLWPRRRRRGPWPRQDP